MNKHSQHLTISFVICVMSGGLFMLIAHFIGNGKIESFDLPIIQFVQGLETPFLTFTLKTFTWIGSAYGVIPITIAICTFLFFGLHHRKQAIFFAFSIASTISFNELLKLYFKRDRPELYRLLEIGGFSFPSGHTMMAFSLYGMIVYIFWHHLNKMRNRILLIVFATMMAFSIAISRIYVGVHFPSDIVGGIAASTFWITLLITVFHLLGGNQKSSLS